MVLVVIPQSIAIKVSNKYSTLRRQKARRTGRLYPIAQLRTNISNALSINGDYIDANKLRNPTYNDWINKGYKVLPYSHWFYAITLMVRSDGEVIAKAVDSLHESDYHNDKMQTKPYENRSLFSSIVKETFRELILLSWGYFCG